MEGGRAIVTARHRLDTRLMVRATMAHLWFRLRLFVVAVFVGGAGLSAYGASRGRTELVLAGLILAVYAVGCLPLTAWRAALKRHKYSRIERFLRFTEDGVESSGATDQPATFGWEAFEFARHNQGFWCLYLRNGLFLVVPDAVLESPDLEALDRLIRAKLPVK